MRMVTAMSPTIAIQNAHALDPSCSNLLVVANQNTHAFGPNSILAKWKVKTKPRSLVVAIIIASVSLLLLGLLGLVLLGVQFRR